MAIVCGAQSLYAGFGNAQSTRVWLVACLHCIHSLFVFLLPLVRSSFRDDAACCYRQGEGLLLLWLDSVGYGAGEFRLGVGPRP